MPEEYKQKLLSRSIPRLHGQLGDLFRSLSPELYALLSQSSRLRPIKAGTILLEDGQFSDEIGYVLSGTLGMVKALADGRQHIIGLLVPTDHFGGGDHEVSGYRIEALSDSQLLCFEGQTFEHILHEQPQAEQIFMDQIRNELDSAREWLRVIGAPKVIQRLAAYLEILARSLSTTAPELPAQQVKVELSRQHLAQYLGTSPESLSRGFREMEDLGILRIVTPYAFDILDPAALRRIRDGEETG